MRLIDADEFKKQIAGMAIANNYPADKANKICELIDSQTTAFNLDKAVEWLIANSMFAQEYVEPLIFLDDAIEIVKSGGIERE